MPWPIGRTFFESSGTVRRSTVRIALTSGSATRSRLPPPACVNQSRTGTPSGRASGAATTA